MLPTPTQEPTLVYQGLPGLFYTFSNTLSHALTNKLFYDYHLSLWKRADYFALVTGAAALAGGAVVENQSLLDTGLFLGLAGSIGEITRRIAVAISLEEKITGKNEL